MFVDDYGGSGKSSDAVFDFLHYQYFPRVSFVRIGLKPSKTILFATQIALLGFELSAGQFRPAHKHRDRYEVWQREDKDPNKTKHSRRS